MQGADDIQDRCNAFGAYLIVEFGEAIADIGVHTHVWKEGGLLGDKSHLATARLEMEPGGGVSQGLAIQGDVAGAGLFEASDEAQQSTFACAGRTEDDSP